MSAESSTSTDEKKQCYDCGRRFDSDAVEICTYFPGGEPLCPDCLPRWSW